MPQNRHVCFKFGYILILSIEQGALVDSIDFGGTNRCKQRRCRVAISALVPIIFGRFCSVLCWGRWFRFFPWNNELFIIFFYGGTDAIEPLQTKQNSDACLTALKSRVGQINYLLFSSCQGRLWQRWRALAKLRRHLAATLFHDFSGICGAECKSAY